MHADPFFVFENWLEENGFYRTSLEMIEYSKQLDDGSVTYIHINYDDSPDNIFRVHSDAPNRPQGEGIEVPTSENQARALLAQFGITV